MKEYETGLEKGTKLMRWGQLKVMVNLGYSCDIPMFHRILFEK
jgi:hypothetical protein